MSEEKLTHWKQLVNPDYLGAYALTPGEDMLLTIKSAALEKIKGKDGKEEMKTVLRFMEKDVKPMILNRTNAKTITKLYKTPYIEQWGGKQILLYAQSGRWFGEDQEALRVRDFVPEKKQVDLTKYLARLNGCKTLTELQEAYLSLPKEIAAMKEMIELKDKLKGTLK